MKRAVGWMDGWMKVMIKEDYSDRPEVMIVEFDETSSSFQVLSSHENPFRPTNRGWKDPMNSFVFCGSSSSLRPLWIISSYHC
jgi:hypothetical protein